MSEAVGTTDFASDGSNVAQSLLMVCRGIDFPAGVSLSMIFGTSALWHRYKTKVPLLMCLAFVSLYQLTISL